MSEDTAVDTLQTQEQNAASQAEFDSGFTGVAPTTTPVEPAPVEPTTDASPASEITDATPPAAEPAPDFVQLTRQELEELRTRAAEVGVLKDDLHRKVSGAYGKMGTLEQRLEQLRNTGRPVEITDEMLTEVGLAEYPELATSIQKLLTRVLSTPSGGSEAAKPDAVPMDPSRIEELVQERMAPVENAVRRKLAIDALADQHPDFEAIRSKPEYHAWIAAQPADKQEQIRTSVNPYFAARVMSEFKEAERKKTETASTRQKIIEAAATPRGTSGNAPAGRTADDDFNAGFNGG